MKPADELECTEVFYFSNDTVDKALRLAGVDIHRKHIAADAIHFNPDSTSYVHWLNP